MSIATSSALLIGAVVVAGAATSITSNMNSISARQNARDIQKKQEAAARALADKSTAPIVSNVGEVQLESSESLEDSAIRDKSTKNRLRIDKTGVSLGGTSSGSNTTGLSI